MERTRVRMAPDSRREQLLDLGLASLRGRSLDEVSVDELAGAAGVSRGLLYHYFGSKQGFITAVVRRSAEDLFTRTAPSGEGSGLDQLVGSLEAYVEWVAANYHAYLSIVRGAAAGHEDLREIYDESRAALTDRFFDGPAAAEVAALGIQDTPAVRLLVRGWAALTEEVVLDWVREDRGLSRAHLVTTLSAALPAILAQVPATR